MMSDTNLEAYATDSASPTNLFKVRRFEIPIKDFDRARLFYTEALGFQSWDADYPLPTNYETLFFHPFHNSKGPQGYFLKISKRDTVALIVLGVRSHIGYERAIFVHDIEEVKKRIVAAGGETLDTSERIPRGSSLSRRRPQLLVKRTKFQDTEGNIVELRCWGFITKMRRE